MKKFVGFERGMGMGGWLTNYKRFQVLSIDKRDILTVGDMEHFRSYITERDVKNIADMGFDHIRMGFDQVVVENEKGEPCEDILSLIDNFVGWCEKHGLNVVLNLHKAVGNYCDFAKAEDRTPFEDEELRIRLIALWKSIAERYADKPFVALELLNEVLDINPELWNDLAADLIKAVREVSNAYIIIGSTCWNNPNRLKDLRVFDDDRVVYTFHFYEPFEFTHQRGVLQPSLIFYNRDMPYPCDVERYRDYRRTICGESTPYRGYDKIDRSYIFDALKPAADFIKAHPDKILWCGEFGNIRHAKLDWRKSWFRDVIAFLKDNDIPYSVWNYLSTPNDGNRFSLVDDETRRILGRDF